VPNSDPINHVIVLMLENRSFDRMLGSLRAVFPGLESLNPTAPHTNMDDRGQAFPQTPAAQMVVQPDPMHDLVNVLRQIGNNNANFVLDYAISYPATTSSQRSEIMAYHAFGSLPVLHTLARNFTICDHWFSSVPGPTWTNRFFVHSGTSLGRVRMPEGVFNLDLHFYDQTTIYDRLNEAGKSWKVYYHDFPQSWVLTHQLEPPNAARYDTISKFFQDAAGPESAFPSYTFIEPKYFWPDQNDDHPPHDSLRAQDLLARVYNAVRPNTALWNSALLVVLYDEHGGFFDQVSPPAAVPPDGHTEEYTFDRLGVRVPALLISPWVSAGVVSTVFDHTSLLKYLTDKWALGPLTARVAQANSVAPALATTGQPRTDTPPSVALPPGTTFQAVVESQPPSPDAINENQHALVAFSRYLETRIQDAPEAKVARFTAAMQNARAQFDVAEERARKFLSQQKKSAAVSGTSG
jgi:phospholipase C